jgi:hypothetical protein|tara:strand:+ start:1507 stop:1827 length:321 start_codon:yes stop_codon:yes gene_type:complete
MKKLLCAIFVLVAASVYSQDVTVLQINAEWNKKNNYDLSGITGAVVKFSYLKDQPKDIQKSIVAVPVIVILDKKGRVRMQYVADISLKIKVGNLDIQNNVDRINSL